MVFQDHQTHLHACDKMSCFSEWEPDIYPVFRSSTARLSPAAAPGGIPGHTLSCVIYLPLGIWSPCPCLALCSLFLYMIPYMLRDHYLDAYFLSIISPLSSNNLLWSSEITFINDPSSQQIIIECLLHAHHGARCQEHRGKSDTIPTQGAYLLHHCVWPPSLISLYSSEMQRAKLNTPLCEGSPSINWKESKTCITSKPPCMCG